LGRIHGVEECPFLLDDGVNGEMSLSVIVIGAPRLLWRIVNGPTCPRNAIPGHSRHALYRGPLPDHGGAS